MIQDLEYNDIPYFAVHPTVDPVILSKAYNSMDIYTHARADGETFGVNIAEAMIHRLPVITHWAEPSHPGMGVFQSQTTLVENGITGYVAVNRVESYTKLLKDMIDFPDTRRRMALEGFEKAMREYHVDACVDKLVKIYRGVVNA
jgi:glycosyltransferase involved in cell wall biosynthesis